MNVIFEKDHLNLLHDTCRRIIPFYLSSRLQNDQKKPFLFFETQQWCQILRRLDHYKHRTWFNVAIASAITQNNYSAFMKFILNDSIAPYDTIRIRIMAKFWCEINAVLSNSNEIGPSHRVKVYIYTWRRFDIVQKQKQKKK